MVPDSPSTLDRLTPHVLHHRGPMRSPAQTARVFRDRSGWLIARLALTTLLAATTACSERPLAPLASPNVLRDLLASAPGCERTCTIVSETDLRPYRAASVGSDSANARVFLAEFVVAGVAGSEVQLYSSASTAFLTAFGAARPLVVDVDGSTKNFTFRHLTQGATVYRFDNADTVRIQYWLSRGLGTVPPIAALLEQRLAGATQLLSAQQPWTARIPSQSGGLTNMSEARCYVPSPGTYCGVTADFIPYYPGSPFGEFQNPPGTGASAPITIQFSSPVDNIAVSIADPDYSGNQLIVHSSSGSTTYDFVGDGIPGQYTEYQIITGDEDVGSIDFLPAANDYVAYFGLSFTLGDSIEVVCTPSSVQRTQTISCEARSSNPSLTVQVSGWDFVGGRNNIIDIQTPSTSTTWAGPLVTSGVVSVVGTLSNGARGTTSQSVTATARSWGSMQARIALVEQNPTTLLPLHPTRLGELGVTALPLGGTWIEDTDYATVPAGGPNAGVLYVTNIPINVQPTVHVNRAALSVGSDFYNLQRNQGSGPWCGKPDVVPFVPVVERHEGLNWEPNSHTGMYRAKLWNIGGPRTEGVVGMNYDQLIAEADFVVGPVLQESADSASWADSAAYRPTYCRFRYF